MCLTINHNMMAANTARNLNIHYDALSVSTRRLSSGLRVGTAADDAAGLAIRELMRADIRTLSQGARNANDAISMIQTADGALQIIDEKLIRMRELAEQAATGTYDSTQRLMIDSEFQAMAAEIDRIANSTDFNGIHLLNGNLSGAHNGSGMKSTGASKIHFGTGNDSAEDYYYVEIEGSRIEDLFDLSRRKIVITETPPVTPPSSPALPDTLPITDAALPAWVTMTLNDAINQNLPRVYTTLDNTPSLQDLFAGRMGTWVNPLTGSSHDDYGRTMFAIPKGTKNIVINTVGFMPTVPVPSSVGENDIELFTTTGIHLSGTPLDDYVYSYNEFNRPVPPNSLANNCERMGFYEYQYDDSILNTGPSAYDPTAQTGQMSFYNGMQIWYTGDPDRYDYGPNNGLVIEPWYDYETLVINEATEDLVVWLPGRAATMVKVSWDGAGEPYTPPKLPVGPEPVETVYYEEAVFHIRTQESAQKMLERIDKAIIKKDKNRAHLGALQNRLENTISNLNIQAENLQGAESRISDVDVATEMTEFARNQILTQSAVAMLAQANSLPKMALQLIGG